MKKGIMVIIIVWVLALTGIVIYSKNKKENIQNEQENVEIKIEDESLDKYQYIDYIGHYDENDLKAEVIRIDEESYSTYVKISGLKNKTLENEINEKLYNMVNELKEQGYKSIYSRVTLNAFNILSVYSETYEGINKHVKTLNIDLTTGNEIKINDILNSSNITGTIAAAYHDIASFAIGAELKYIDREIDMYNWCIEHGNKDCNSSILYESIEEIQNKKTEYENILANMEDEALIYARNFDYNQKFIITSEGIEIPSVNIHDIKSNNDMIIHTKNNPRLYNFYYKYKTESSIFDGSYQGIKNLFIADSYNYRYNNIYDIRIIDDYALIDYNADEYFDDKNHESIKTYLENYEKQLDKNIFTIANYFEIYEKIEFTECKMTKETFENKVKKQLADEKIRSRYETYGSLANYEGVTCELKNIFFENLNIVFSRKTVEDDKIINYVEVSGLEDKNKEKEINDKIQNRIQELKNNNYNNIYMYTKKINEYNFELGITYIDTTKQIVDEILTFNY